MSSVRVLFFAAARDVVGEREVSVDLDDAGTTVHDFARVLTARWPALAPHVRSLRIAVNGEYARDADPVRPGDEVAVIPPVAGGA